VSKHNVIRRSGTIVVVPRKYLELILKQHIQFARPYTGEYDMGKVDLAAELLGKTMDWEDFNECRFVKQICPTCVFNDEDDYCRSMFLIGACDYREDTRNKE
jgi:hypothetical protein